jgi:RNA polymerase sigma factor (sigma-70 family)
MLQEDGSNRDLAMEFIYKNWKQDIHTEIENVGYKEEKEEDIHKIIFKSFKKLINAIEKEEEIVNGLKSYFCSLIRIETIHFVMNKSNNPPWKDDFLAIARKRGCDSNEANEALQNGRIDFYKHLSKNSDVKIDNAKAYMSTCVSHAAGKILKTRLKTSEPTDAESCSSNYIDDMNLERDKREITRKLLAGLADIDRKILELFYINSYKLEEIADILDIDKANIKMRKSRALARLRTYAEQSGSLNAIKELLE